METFFARPPALGHVRRAAPLLAILLVVSLAPHAQAAAITRVDSLVDVVSATEMLERQTFHYTGGSASWSLRIPEGSTPVEARDGSGTLSFQVAGDDVTVRPRSSPFVVSFRLPIEKDGPFHLAKAEVFYAYPTTAAIRLAEGWTLAGHRASPDAIVGADGVLRAEGALLAEFLVLPPGIADPGADPRVAGAPIRRDAIVEVGESSSTMSVTVTYDTDRYRRAWSYPLPEGARLVSVTTPLGPVDAVEASGAAEFTLPYPDGFGLGGRPFTVRMTLPPAEPHGGAFRTVKANIAAGADDTVQIEFLPAPALVATGVHASDNATMDGLRATATGPLAATLAYLPQAGPGVARFTVAPWTIETPAELEPAARATAEAAASMLPQVAGFVGGDAIERPFFVAYTDAPVFDWEEGFYSPGLNTISIRASELRNVTDGKAHLKPVQVLAHETAHGLLDRLVDGGPSDLSFFQEGVARLVETNVELRMQDEVLECTRANGRESCLRHSARAEAEAVRDFHKASNVFDPTWTTRTAAADQRGFLYDYSGLALNAYVRTSPEGALATALRDIGNAPGPDDPDVASVRFVDALLLQSPTLSRAALLHPGREAAALPLEEFRGCMGDLVAPGFPFDPAPRMPAGGCPTPPAPTPEERASLMTAPTDTPVATPTPGTPTPPPRVVPVSTVPTLGGGETSGGIVESPSATAVEVPLPAWMAVAALALVAWAASRRR